MRIKLIGIFFTLLFLFIPYQAFAQEVNVPNIPGVTNFQAGDIDYKPSFTPPVTDLSVNYLGQLFGTVGTVLHGTSGQLLGTIFKVLNIGFLVLAGFFLIYTIFMTVLNAAHEGEFMGRKWNSAWIAIRTVMGLGLLVPSATTGYSTVQVLVMWIVIQGVGFADMAWSSAIRYIAEGGQVYTPPDENTVSMVDLAGTLLEMQVCMYKAQEVEKNLQEAKAKAAQEGGAPNAAQAQPSRGTLNFSPIVSVTSKNNVYTGVVKFPGKSYDPSGNQADAGYSACGQISWSGGTQSTAANSERKARTIEQAINQMILTTRVPAQQIAQARSANTEAQAQSAVVGAAADWVNITLPIRAASASVGDVLLAGYVKTAIEQGWIMAGRYYYALGNVKRATADAASVKVNVDVAPAGMVKPPDNNPIGFDPPPAVNTATMQSLTAFSDEDKQNLAAAMDSRGVAGYVAKARNLASRVDKASKVNLNIGSAGILGVVLNPITSVLTVAIGQLTTLTGDPITVLQTMGYSFMGLATALWLGGTIAIFAIGTISSAVASLNPLAYSVEDAVFAFIPVFVTFTLMFFVLGGMFAYYIPLIPFIIFVFAAVGWLIAVIEAMVAAPLVALGITHPEGHDLLGKSEQAIMLLLSVFLRPVLMIIGLIAGMILSRVVLRFLNSGFFGIVFDVSDLNLFAFVAILFIYAMLMMTIVNQAFSLIYLVPDRVMRWLGVTEQTTGAQEALQSAKGGYEQIAGGTEKLGGGITGTGATYRKEQLAKERKRAETEKPPTIGGPGGGGGP